MSILKVLEEAKTKIKRSHKLENYMATTCSAVGFAQGQIFFCPCDTLEITLVLCKGFVLYDGLGLAFRHVN